MNAQMRTRMDRHARKRLENWIVKVESTEEQHVQSVHLFSKELDPAQTDVRAADGVLHVRVPKKNHPTEVGLHSHQQPVSD